MLSLADARTYAARSLYWLAMAAGTTADDKENLLAYAAALPDEMTPALAKGGIVALQYVLAGGENKTAATAAALWCGVLWARWQGSPSALELGAPPPPPPPT